MAAILGAVVLIELAVTGTWWFISRSRLGQLEFDSGRAILTVQVFDESGKTQIGEPINVVKKATVTLPDGEYRLRVTGDGLLGRTYLATANRGETISVNLSLDEGRLLGGDRNPAHWDGNLPREDPIPFAVESLALELAPGESDIVEFTGRSVTRRDGLTGKVRWDAASPKSAFDRDHDPKTWLDQINPSQTVVSLIDSAQDLDKDGTGDVVLLGSGEVGWIAISGNDGSMLWECPVRRPTPADTRAQSSPKASVPDSATLAPSDVLGQSWIDDIDGDGVRELVATVVFQSSPRARRQPRRVRAVPLSQRVVQATSGRTGVPLWTFPLEAEPAAIGSWFEPATVLRGRRSTFLGVRAGQRWMRLDPHRGRPHGIPIDLGFEPERPLQYADCDGDGEAEILALGKGPTGQDQLLSAIACATGKTLWTTTIAAAFPGPRTGRKAEWPWLIDLDGDGRCEVIVPDSGALSPAGAYRGIRSIDGVSGQTRWVAPMRPENKTEDGLSHVVPAPDLDGDGIDDLVALSWYEGRIVPPWNRRNDRFEPARAFADAISGRDGRLLWSWHADLLEEESWHIGMPRWWGLGPDGHPLLAVPIGGQNTRGPGSRTYPHTPSVHILEASTGRERHLVMGLNQVDAADLNGDGITDLWGEFDGQLRAFRGEPPEIWRSVSNLVPATDAADVGITWSSERHAVDFDADKIGDVLTSGLNWAGAFAQGGATGSRTLIARSGRDGHLLWKTTLDPPSNLFHDDPARSYKLAAFALPGGDLDGDRVADVVIRKTDRPSEATSTREPARPAIQVLSGKNGRLLWSAESLRLPFESHGDSPVTWYRTCAIEPNAAPDLLVAHRCPLVKAGSIPTTSPLGIPSQDRLARISGRTGRVLWDIALEAEMSARQPWARLPFMPIIADVDGDRSMDAVWLVQRGTTLAYDVKVISLRDGAITWSHAWHGGQPVVQPPLIEIAEARTGQPATVCLIDSASPDNRNEKMLQALDGRDGTVRWFWNGEGLAGENWSCGAIGPTNLDANAKDSVCVICYTPQRKSCMVILDSQGNERSRRDLPPELVSSTMVPPTHFYPLDLDGDGRDEFLLWTDSHHAACDRDLKMRWCIASNGFPTGQFLPTAPGKACTLFIGSLTAIDGRSGHTRWSEKSPGLMGFNVLNAGDSTGRPLLLASHRDRTTCRQALGSTPKGGYVMPEGGRVPRNLVIDDPRWVRPLPWVEPMRQFVTLRYALAAVALAVANVFVPLGILRLAAGRQVWRVRTLTILPLVVAFPFWTFQAAVPLLPPLVGAVPLSEKVIFLGGTLTGIPIVILAGATVLGLIRLRWRTLGTLAGLTIAAALIIATVWLRYDSRVMPTIEHYDRSGWAMCLALGAYAAGLLQLIIGALTLPYRLLRGGYRRSPGV